MRVTHARIRKAAVAKGSLGRTQEHWKSWDVSDAEDKRKMSLYVDKSIDVAAAVTVVDICAAEFVSYFAETATN